MQERIATRWSAQCSSTTGAHPEAPGNVPQPTSYPQQSVCSLHTTSSIHASVHPSIHPSILSCCSRARSPTYLLRTAPGSQGPCLRRAGHLQRACAPDNRDSSAIGKSPGLVVCVLLWPALDTCTASEQSATVSVHLPIFNALPHPAYK